MNGCQHVAERDKELKKNIFELLHLLFLLESSGSKILEVSDLFSVQTVTEHLLPFLAYFIKSCKV
jgi:hypothetical protein